MDFAIGSWHESSAVETLKDRVNAAIQGIQNRAYGTAQAVTWIIRSLYPPVRGVSLVGVMWVLVVRGGELHVKRRPARDVAAQAIRSKEYRTWQSFRRPQRG